MAAPLRSTAVLLPILFWAPVSGAAVTTPDEHLGRPLGADFALADWDEVSGYFRRIDAESPRIRVETVGTTTEGRDFLLAVLGSEANLARLPEIREASRRIADPRGLTEEEARRALAEAVPIVFVSCAMHATEAAAPQFAMALAHRMITDEEGPFARARERVLLLVAPSLNPDGQDHVVSWYRETVGTPYEATQLLKLYQRYAGHDNNRDWFALTQAETRIVTELLYSKWRPQVYWDVHQQGSSAERFFVPPYRDPLNPNLDPAIVTGLGTLGARALFDMTAEGLSGVATGVTYDMWWNGGNRNVPVRHNVMGILTEAASVKIASPVFLEPDRVRAPAGLASPAPSNRYPDPWPGGWWRLRDIIDYELSFAASLLASVAREPQTWLGNAMAAARRALERAEREGPRAWLIPSDNPDRGAARRLAETLLLGGVEIHAADAPLSADGREWPAGSLVIPMAQPYATHVQDLFEVQRYPEGPPPYDVSGWTLPLLFGLRRVEIFGDIQVPSRRIATAEEAVAGFPGRRRGRLRDGSDSDSWRAAWATLAEGGSAALGTEGEDRGWLKVGGAPAGDGWRRLRSAPRIGLYAPWSGSMDEGWMRWVFDTNGVPYRRVRNEMLRAGKLGDLFDVLVVASISGDALDLGRAPGTVHPRYARGLDPEGAVAVEEFVRLGGTLVAMGSSAAWAVDLFELPLTDMTKGEGVTFSCPGSVLRGIPAQSPWTAGLPASVALFFARGTAWSVPPTGPTAVSRGALQDGGEAPAGGTAPAGVQTPASGKKVEVLLRYAPTRVLLSGWIEGPEAIEDRAAWVRAPHGEGQVHLFGFRPQYRGWSQDTFELLYRAILIE